MNTTSFIGVLTIAIQVTAMRIWLKRDTRTIETDVTERVAQSRDGSAVNRVAHSIAAPVAATKSVGSLSTSPSMKLTRQRVEASGKFGGDVEVFLAYQIAAVFIGSVIAAAGFFLSGTALPFAIAIFGAYVAAYPYKSVKEAAKKAEEAAAESIPEFADLLQIALAGSMTIQNAMRFAAENLPNNRLVSTNVSWLVETLDRGTMGELEAYTAAGQKMGSPEAAALFATLGRAAVSGSAASDTIARQAKNLRNLRYQKRRERIKKVPVKMIGAFAVFFLPVLLAVLLMPVFTALGALT